tara:strand:- start:45 stop:1178 length:1134 start_codon:yes stop_codon:yes gene_type:complete
MFIFFKRRLKYFYKRVIEVLFFLLYKKPKLKLKNGDYSEKIFDIRIDKNLYKLFEFNEGRIFTDGNDTTAYISKNNNISEASLQYKKFDFINSKIQTCSKNEVLTKGTPKFKKKINGNLLSLLSGGASRDNFTHWFTDIIPRIKIYQQKFNIKKIDKFYIPSIKYKFQRESLSYLGINENNIISSEKYKHVEAKKIYATTHPCFHKPTMVKKWSIKYLNKIYRNNSNIKKYQKIFINRDQLKFIDKSNLKKFAEYRVLLNENEIKNYLTSIGFITIKPEEHSFSDQLKMFSSAKCVVGLYGAAMMMLAFCKKKTKVLEFKPTGGGMEFRNISKLAKLKHRQIILKPLVKSRILQNGILLCPISRIKKELKLLGLKDL